MAQMYMTEKSVHAVGLGASHKTALSTSPVSSIAHPAPTRPTALKRPSSLSRSGAAPAVAHCDEPPSTTLEVRREGLIRGGGALLETGKEEARQGAGSQRAGRGALSVFEGRESGGTGVGEAYISEAGVLDLGKELPADGDIDRRSEESWEENQKWLLGRLRRKTLQRSRSGGTGTRPEVAQGSATGKPAEADGGEAEGGGDSEEGGATASHGQRAPRDGLGSEEGGGGEGNGGESHSEGGEQAAAADLHPSDRSSSSLKKRVSLLVGDESAHRVGVGSVQEMRDTASRLQTAAEIQLGEDGLALGSPVSRGTATSFTYTSGEDSDVDHV